MLNDHGHAIAKEEEMEKVTIIRGVKMIVEQKAVDSTDKID